MSLAVEVVGPEGTGGLHGGDPLRRWKQGLVKRQAEGEVLWG